MTYLIGVLGRLLRSASLRLQITYVGMSTVTYGVSILLLNDGDRGTLTAFLYSSYLIVGLAFFGSNTMIAHWDKGPYETRIRLSTKMSKPGLASGMVLVLISLVVFLFGFNVSDELIVFTGLLGLSVFLRTLGETIFMAKTSSKPATVYWQHYLYFAIFSVCLVYLIATDNVGVTAILVAYLVASTPFLFAKWVSHGKNGSSARSQTGDLRFERLSAAKLFLGTFASSMQIRLVSLVIVALYGTEYLGKYLVLWLSFEVIEQLYKFLLFTKVHDIKDKILHSSNQAQWGNWVHFFRLGVPGILLIATMVFFAAPRIISLPAGELAVSVLLLTGNYLARLVLNYRLTYLQATDHIGLASRLSVGNTLVAVSLVAVLPLFMGFLGVAAALMASSLATLLGSTRLPKSVNGV